MTEIFVRHRTRRGATFIDDIEFAVPSQPTATGHLVIPDRPTRRTGILALHHARGDRTSLLSDLRTLADSGFVGLAVDCPISRRAAAARNPIDAHIAMLATARAGLRVLRAHDDVDAAHIAVLGRGTGGSVAARLATDDGPIDLVVTINTPPSISSHYAASDDPVAAAMRLRLDPAAIEQLRSALVRFDLTDTIVQTSDTQWALSTANDDSSGMQMSEQRSKFPRTVRFMSQTTSAELLRGAGADERCELVKRLSI